MLAHVLEANGVATVSLSSMRGFTERMNPPRALHCDFPLGRPLGVPGDAVFQRGVLDAAFALLEETKGPVLVDYGETIEDVSEVLSCAVPPGIDASLHAAIDEAKSIRPAYNRAMAQYGETNVGRVADADGIPELIQAFVESSEGKHWKELSIPPRRIMDATKDIMNYYEEAALDLSGHVPAARQAETWFFKETETGKLLMAAREAMRGQEAPFWFYVVPFTQG